MRRIITVVVMMLLICILYTVIHSYEEISDLQYDVHTNIPVGIMAIDMEATLAPLMLSEPIEEVEEETEFEAEPQQWWTDEELDMLAALIYYEAGSNDCSDRHQQLVVQVVLNRINSNEFPDTIYDVITQTKHGIQYSTYKSVLKNMGNRDVIPQRCYDNALVALNGEVDCPDNIVWQANFTQGSEIYEVHKTSYSTTYFCYR